MKRLYCTKCKEHPELIEESIVMVFKRKWNGEGYKAYETIDTGEAPIHICSKCGLLVDEEKEFINDILLPEVQGEVGDQKDIFPEDPSYQEKRDLQDEDEVTG